MGSNISGSGQFAESELQSDDRIKKAAPNQPSDMGKNQIRELYIYERGIREGTCVPDEQNLVLLCRFFVKQGEILRTEYCFEQLRQLSPAHPDAVRFFLRYLDKLGDYTRLKTVLREACAVETNREIKATWSTELARIEDQIERATRELPKLELEDEAFRSQRQLVGARIYNQGRPGQIRKMRYNALKQTGKFSKWVDALRDELSQVCDHAGFRMIAQGDRIMPPSLMESSFTSLSDEDKLRLILLQELAHIYRHFVKDQAAFLSILNEMVKLLPDDKTVLLDLAGVYRILGRYRDEARIGEKYLTLFPEQTHAWEELVLLCELTKQYEKWVAILEKQGEREKSPLRKGAYLYDAANVALTYLQDPQLSLKYMLEALPCFDIDTCPEEALVLAEHLYEVTFNLELKKIIEPHREKKAVLEMESGHLEQAYKILRDVCTLKPSKMDYWKRYCHLSVKLEKQSEFASHVALLVGDVERDARIPASAGAIAEMALEACEGAVVPPNEFVERTLLQTVLKFNPGHEKAFLRLKQILVLSEDYRSLQQCLSDLSASDLPIMVRASFYYEAALVSDTMLHDPLNGALFAEKALECQPLHFPAMAMLERLYTQLDEREKLFHLLLTRSQHETGKAKHNHLLKALRLATETRLAPKEAGTLFLTLMTEFPDAAEIEVFQKSLLHDPHIFGDGETLFHIYENLLKRHVEPSLIDAALPHYLSLGRFEQACEILVKKAEQQQVPELRSHTCTAIARLYDQGMGDIENALAALEMSLQLRPDQPHALVHLYEILVRPKTESKDRDLALALLAGSYENQKRYNELISIYVQSSELDDEERRISRLEWAAQLSEEKLNDKLQSFHLWMLILQHRPAHELALTRARELIEQLEDKLAFVKMVEFELKNSPDRAEETLASKVREDVSQERVLEWISACEKAGDPHILLDILLKVYEEWSLLLPQRAVIQAILDSVQSSKKKPKELAKWRVMLARVCVQQRDYIKAKTELELAFRADPLHVDWLFELAQMCLEQGNFSEAQKHYRALLLQKLDNTSITKGDVYFGLGEAAWHLGDFDGAKEMYQIASEVTPHEKAKERLLSQWGIASSTMPNRF